MFYLCLSKCSSLSGATNHGIVSLCLVDVSIDSRPESCCVPQADTCCVGCDQLEAPKSEGMRDGWRQEWEKAEAVSERAGGKTHKRFNSAWSKKDAGF